MRVKALELLRFSIPEKRLLRREGPMWTKLLRFGVPFEVYATGPNAYPESPMMLVGGVRWSRCLAVQVVNGEKCLEVQP